MSSMSCIPAARLYVLGIDELRNLTRRAGRFAGLGFCALSWPVALMAAEGWNPESSMGTARAHHAAALMDDGSVGVFGGINSSGFIQTGERYSEGIWTPAGVMGTFGNATEAVTLGTGQVLVRSDGSASARLYDPVTNTWISGGVQTTVRTRPSMTLLPSGKVLVAGGSSTNSAELYDPETRTWHATGSMLEARRSHGAVLLSDGRVLVASGVNDGGVVHGAELYDPNDETWAAVAGPLHGRYGASLTLLPDGRALLAGGRTALGVVTDAELFDQYSNTWTATGSLHVPREGVMGSPLGHGTVLSSGLVLIAGGADSAAGAGQSSTELYNRATGTWSEIDPMSVGRQSGTATLLPSGDVLFTGGFTNDPSLTFYSQAERYVPAWPAGPVPVLDALPLMQRSGAPLSFTGTGFTGTAGGSTPQLQLQRVENGAMRFVAPASSSSTSFTAPSLGVLPAGLYMARLMVDGVPSVARLIRFTDTVGSLSGTSGDARVSVTWTPPVNNGGNPPEGYVVTSSPGDASCSVDAPATSCTVTGLENGTPYVFTVRARHPNGLGPAASTPSAITPTGSGSVATPVAVPGLTAVGVALTALLAAAMGGGAIRRRHQGK